MRLTVVDRRWAGCRCIVAAPGPSLPFLAEQCREHPRIIAVNDAVELLPNAAICYGCDGAWWEARNGLPDFAGEKWTSYSLSPKNIKSPEMVERYGLRVIRGDERPGFSRSHDVIFYNNNSGAQAINLAILFDAAEIVLIGFDMRPVNGRTHYFGEHRAPLRATGSFTTWIAKFTRAAEMLGGSPRIINSTPNSALTCFPYMPLAEALSQRIAA